jgi:hypothetical protein
VRGLRRKYNPADSGMQARGGAELRTGCGRSWQCDHLGEASDRRVPSRRVRAPISAQRHAAALLACSCYHPGRRCVTADESVPSTLDTGATSSRTRRRTSPGTSARTPTSARSRACTLAATTVRAPASPCVREGAAGRCLPMTDTRPACRS